MAPAILFVLQPLATPEHTGFLSQGTQMLPLSQVALAALYLRVAVSGEKGNSFPAPFLLSSPGYAVIPLSSSNPFVLLMRMKAWLSK